MRTLGAACLTLTLASPLAAGEILLKFPLDCTLGSDCYIQHYTDQAPGPAARDYTCGALVYDAHRGTDIAVPWLAAMVAGVNVLAAAPGKVGGARDGVRDVLFGSPGAPDISGQECGNGVSLIHEDGWVTQYCHMKEGSIRVQKGDQVAQGDVLGQVGLSGKTQFPHLHLSVRRDGDVVDPFQPEAMGTCGADTDATLWEDPPPYVPGGWIATGLASAVPEYEDIKAGIAQTRPGDDPEALVLWGYAYGTRRGDTVLFSIIGPDGPVHQARVRLDRDQAQMFRASGKRRPAGGWARGTYDGLIRLTRDGAEISRQVVNIELN